LKSHTFEQKNFTNEILIKLQVSKFTNAFGFIEEIPHLDDCNKTKQKMIFSLEKKSFFKDVTSTNKDSNNCCFQNVHFSKNATSSKWRQDIPSTSHSHRDKTRVQMPAKIFPQLKVKC
jgi:hypothetical protein